MELDGAALEAERGLEERELVVVDELVVLGEVP